MHGPEPAIKAAERGGIYIYKHYETARKFNIYTEREITEKGPAFGLERDQSANGPLGKGPVSHDYKWPLVRIREVEGCKRKNKLFENMAAAQAPEAWKYIAAAADGRNHYEFTGGSRAGARLAAETKEAAN